MFCSWSGGKDSCLALYKAKKDNYNILALITMCIEIGDRSRAHGKLEILKAQADSMKIPLFTQSTTWENYRINFIKKLNAIKQQYAVKFGLFGDIDLDAHKKWEEELCLDVGMSAIIPLWKIDRKTVINEFLSAGFKAVIVSLCAKRLHPKYLGRRIDKELILEFEDMGIDPCGENGEFHTVVTDGPLFTFPLILEKFGNPILNNGYWVQDFTIIENYDSSNRNYRPT